MDFSEATQPQKIKESAPVYDMEAQKRKAGDNSMVKHGTEQQAPQVANSKILKKTGSTEALQKAQ